MITCLSSLKSTYKILEMIYWNDSIIGRNDIPFLSVENYRICMKISIHSAYLKVPHLFLPNKPGVRHVLLQSF